MKKIILISLLCCKIAAQKSVKYYDIEGKEISAEKFNQNRSSEKTVYGIKNFDSVTEYRQIYRTEIGKLSPQNLSILKALANVSDEKDFWVFVFYPGADRCNTLGRPSTWNMFDDDFERKLGTIGTYEIQWLSKVNDDNLKDLTNNKTSWKLDPKHFFEQTFFKMHYPCFSSVVVDREGNYVINKAEFGKQDVWEATKILKKKRKK